MCLLPSNLVRYQAVWLQPEILMECGLWREDGNCSGIERDDTLKTLDLLIGKDSGCAYRGSNPCFPVRLTEIRLMCRHFVASFNRTGEFQQFSFLSLTELRRSQTSSG